MSAYTQQPSYNLSHKYPQSSTQRCWTYRPRIAHARERQPYLVETDILGIVAYAHLLGEVCCPISKYNSYLSVAKLINNQFGYLVSR